MFTSLLTVIYYFRKEQREHYQRPMQRPIQYPDRVTLFESDLVEPLVLRGATDVITVAERQELLNLRAQNANLLRLVGKLLQRQLTHFYRQLPHFHR